MWGWPCSVTCFSWFLQSHSWPCSVTCFSWFLQSHSWPCSVTCFSWFLQSHSWPCSETCFPWFLQSHPFYSQIDLVVWPVFLDFSSLIPFIAGERGGSVVECRTSEREVRGSRPTSAVLCPWARHFTPRKYWLITQEAMAPSRHDWKIVDWDVKPQHNLL